MLCASDLNSEVGGLSTTIQDDEEVLNQGDDSTSLFSLNDGALVNRPSDYIGLGAMSMTSLFGIALDTRLATPLSGSGHIYFMKSDGCPLLSVFSTSFDRVPNAGYTLLGSVFCPAQSILINMPQVYVHIVKFDVGDLVPDQLSVAWAILCREAWQTHITAQTTLARIPESVLGPDILFSAMWVFQRFLIAAHLLEFESGKLFVCAMLLLDSGLSRDESIGSVNDHYPLFAERLARLPMVRPRKTCCLRRGFVKPLGMYLGHQLICVRGQNGPVQYDYCASRHQTCRNAKASFRTIQKCPQDCPSDQSGKAKHPQQYNLGRASAQVTLPQLQLKILKRDSIILF